MFGTKRLKSKSHNTYLPARATDSLLKHRLPLHLLLPLPTLPHPLPLPLPPAPPTAHFRKPSRHPPTPTPPLRLANSPYVSKTNLSINQSNHQSIYQCNPIIKDKHGTAKLSHLLPKQLSGTIKRHEPRLLIIRIIHNEPVLVETPCSLLGLVVVFEDGEEVGEGCCYCTVW